MWVTPSHTYAVHQLCVVKFWIIMSRQLPEYYIQSMSGVSYPGMFPSIMARDVLEHMFKGFPECPFWRQQWILSFALKEVIDLISSGEIVVFHIYQRMCHTILWRKWILSHHPGKLYFCHFPWMMWWLLADVKWGNDPYPLKMLKNSRYLGTVTHTEQQWDSEWQVVLWRQVW
jgi:hypothetical protein